MLLTIDADNRHGRLLAMDSGGHVRILVQGLKDGLNPIVALVAGWWIARTALRPIERISRTVRAVGESRDLSRRLRS